MKFEEIAWRGWVTKDGAVIAWPTLLADHNEFLRTFHVREEEFAGRWRQWRGGTTPDFDPGTPEESKAIVVAWLQNGGRA